MPEFTERGGFREVLVKGRLAAALRKVNLRDGRPWLDGARVARANRDLEQAAGHRPLEVILHKLTHPRHPHHGPELWRAVAAPLPD